MELKPCSRCGVEPVRMGLDYNIVFENSMGHAVMCPVCKRSTGYFAEEERAYETWNEMNHDAP